MAPAIEFSFVEYQIMGACVMLIFLVELFFMMQKIIYDIYKGIFTIFIFMMRERQKIIPQNDMTIK